MNSVSSKVNVIFMYPKIQTKKPRGTRFFIVFCYFFVLFFVLLRTILLLLCFLCLFEGIVHFVDFFELFFMYVSKGGGSHFRVFFFENTLKIQRCTKAVFVHLRISSMFSKKNTLK